MPPREVHLPLLLERALRAAALARAPREFVALLGGAGDQHSEPNGEPNGDAARRCTIAAWCELANAATADDRFTVTAASFAAAEATLRAAGHRWLGFLHSHPRGAARLSPIDRTSLWRDCLQLVLGLGDAAADEPTLRGFWLHGDAVLAVPLGTDATAEVPA